MNRRDFLAASARAFGGFAVAPLAAFAQSAPDVAPVDREAELETQLETQLERSPFVYVSPLLDRDRESRCHAELWFAWLDGAVVVIVSADRWKARALRSGRDKARIWVGDHGRWRGLMGENEAFRRAPSFTARGEIVRDRALLERLLATYEAKYPAEIAQWRDRMRTGYADGTRVLIRYARTAT